MKKAFQMPFLNPHIVFWLFFISFFITYMFFTYPKVSSIVPALYTIPTLYTILLKNLNRIFILNNLGRD